jgi:tRNA-splicing endonuclease subunit Sen2
VAIRALWESGFFGKGSLSRSEPSWLEREKRRLGLSATQTSEEITQKRREERKEFKRNRAKMEREIIESQLQKEGKKLSAVEAGVSKPNVNDAKSHSVLQEPNSTKDGQAALLPAVNSSTVPPSRTSSVSFIADKSIEAKNPAPLAQKLKFETTLPRKASGLAAQRQTDPDPPTEVRDQEHLQLTPEEAFFLVYGLGILEVWDDDGRAPMATASLFQRFRQWSYFPPRSSSLLQMDDPFILSYVVYHHFRSLGWVVRSGVKFATDYLLYNRGPVFSHAEFAAVIIPSYSHPYYADCPHQQQLGKSRGSKSWHWLHCVNRVQSQVRKNLVLVFVEVPPPLEHGMGGEQPDQFVTDIGGMLKRYQVREVNVKRWIPNRSRD